MTSTILTVSSANLAQLLGDVVKTAGSDGTLPMLAGVTIYTAVDKGGDTVLVAASTDRYCALLGHVKASGTLPHKLWLTRGQVSQIRTAVSPYTSRRRALDSQVEILVEDGKVTFRQIALDDLAAVAVTFPAKEGDGPKIGELIEKARELAVSDEPFHVDGKRIALFAQIAGSRRGVLSMQSRGATKAVFCQIGDNLVGLLMPVRPGSETSKPLDAPIYLPTVLTQVDAA